MTPSAMVRALVEKDFGEVEQGAQTLGARSARWVGAVSDSRVAPGSKARESLAGWSPDRRG
jgi:hypothetical protein